MNDNKLGRFIKVMSGGEWITDKTLASRLGKVNTAIQSAETACNALAQARLTDPAIARRIADVKQSRDDAMNNAGKPAKYEALEPLKGVARQLAQDAQQRSADALLQNTERGVTVQTANPLLQQLGVAANQLIDQGAKANYLQQIQGFTQTRDTLANAATVDQLAQATIAAAQLVNGLRQAVNGAQNAVQTERLLQQQQPQKLGLVDQALNLLDTTVSNINDPVETPGLRQEAQTLRTRRDLLANAATPREIVAQVKLADQLVIDIGLAQTAATTTGTHVTDATIDAANTKAWLDSAEGWSRWLDRTAAPNPASAALPAQQQEYTRILSEPASARRPLFNAVILAVQPIVDGCTALMPLLDQATKAVHAADVLIRQLDPADRGLLGDSARLAASIKTRITNSPLATLATCLTGVEVQALALTDRVDTVQAGRKDAVALNRSIATGFDAVQQAIDALPPPQTELSQALQVLRQRQAQAGNLALITQKKELVQIERDTASLLAKAKKAQFTAQASSPQGRQQLDELIARFGEATTNPMDQAICQGALAARFNMDVEVPPGLKANRLPALYGLLKDLPERFQGIDQIGKLEIGSKPIAAHNYHTPGTPGTTKGVIGLHNIPEVDGVYNFDGDRRTVPTPSYFKATALHEAGHGVDAQFGVMAANGASAGFGQWRNETIDSAAAAYGARLAAVFAGVGLTPTETDLVALCKQVLSGANPVQPADDQPGTPLGSLFADWNAISTHAVITVCREATSGSSPWTLGENFANRAQDANGRVIFEAYPGDWKSYVYGERATTGVSSYQWRSPVEWFAELFALYHLTGRNPPTAVAPFIIQ